MQQGSEVDLVELTKNRNRSQDDYVQFQFVTAAHLSAYVGRFVELPGKRVLDLGCGTGGIGVYLASIGCNVIGMDDGSFGMQSLATGARFARSKGLPPLFVSADVHRVPVKDASFDVIIMNSVIEHVADPEQAMREIGRILKPGGLAFVDFPLYYSPYGHHMREFFPIPWQPILFPSRMPGWLAQRFEDPEKQKYWLAILRGFSKLTIRRYLEIVRRTGFDLIHFRKNTSFTPPGQKMLSTIKKAILKGQPGQIPAAFSTAAREFDRVTFLEFLFFVAIFPFQWVPYLDELTCPGISTIVRRPARQDRV